MVLAFVTFWTWMSSYAYKSGERRIRPAAVAGLFYPNEPGALRKTVQGLLDDRPGVTVSGKVRALVSPHAGYINYGDKDDRGYFIKEKVISKFK